MQKKNGVKVTAILLLVVMIAATLAGCSRIKSLFDSSDETEKTGTVNEDTVMIVGDMQVSEAEWFLYMQPEREKIEALYGEKVWDYKLESIDKTMAEAIRDEVRNKIAYIKTVCLQASGLGISLNEDDMIDVNVKVEDYLLASENMPESDKEAFKTLGIDENLIRKVYSDNQLATKVYEHLTLNVDTTIDEDSVRYMVLQYISFLKFTSDANDQRVDLTPEQLEEVGRQANALWQRISSDETIKMLSDIGDETQVSELILNHEGVASRFGSEIADAAFALREGQFSGLIETDEGYFILDCVSESDKDMTNAAKIAVIESRQETVFDEAYETWKEETEVRIIDKQ